MQAVRWLTLLTLFILASCKGGGEGVEAAKNVTVNTGGIFIPISIKVQPQGTGAPFFEKEAKGILDLDEYLFDSGDYLLRVIVTNNTDFPMENMAVDFPGQETDEWGFEKSDEGENIYPGKTGTCGTRLLPKKTCTIMLAFMASASAGSMQYSQQVVLQYNNLVEPDNRSWEFTVFAGFAAKLNFQEFETMFYFGDKVGLAQKPVLERSEPEEFHKKLIVTNSGDLRARDIVVDQGVACQNFAGGSCDSSVVDGAWWYEHDCPTELLKNEQCEIDVYFVPLNQDPLPDPDHKEVRYDATALLTYFNSPLMSPAALNGYFTTFSTTVEARFETSIDSLIFEETVIGGNRVTRVFKSQNNGYVAGEIRWFHFSNTSDGSHVASCRKMASDADYLKCFAADLTTELTLEDFPFYIKDRQQCMTDETQEPVLVAVDDGCVFDFYFQPSIAYDTVMTFSHDMDAEFDSRWKGIVDNMVTQWQHETGGNSINPAKLEITELQFAGNTIDPVVPFTTTTPDGQFDLGRLALMNKSFYTRNSMKITFENTGGVEVNISNFYDGSGNEIPKSASNPSGIDIGTHWAPDVYYEGAILNSADCDVIPPGGKCKIAMSFAPIGYNNTQQEWENMFDFIHPTDPLQHYKEFYVSYWDQALYTDANIDTDTRDIPNREAHATLKAFLVKKGYLKQYNDVDIGQDIFIGNYKVGFGVVQNIGTGDIPYMPYNHYDYPDVYDWITNKPTVDEPIQLIANDDPIIPADILTAMTAEGAQHDCMDVIDFGGFQDADDRTVVDARSGVKNPLAPGEKCLITWKLAPGDEFLSDDTALLELPTSGNEIGRKYVIDDLGTKAAHMAIEGCDGCDHWMVIDYFDGDLTDPGRVGPLANDFGNHIKTEHHSEEFPLAHLRDKKVGGDVDTPGFMVALGPKPEWSAIMYRPSFNLPQVMIDGVEHLAASTVPEVWFWSPKNIQGPDIESEILPAYFSWTANSAWLQANHTGHEHVIHMGTFPTGEGEFDGSFTLASPSEAKVKLISEAYTGPGDFVINTNIDYANDTTWQEVPGVAAITGTAAYGGGYPKNFTFEPTAAGTYEGSYEYKYQTGVFINGYDDTGGMEEKRQKVKIVAKAIDDAPRMKVTEYTYEITPQIDPTIEALISPDVDNAEDFDPADGVEVVLGWNTKLGDATSEPTKKDTVLLESIKIDNPDVGNFYVKKRLVLQNQSTTYPMNNLKFLWKGSATSSTTSTLTDPQIDFESNCTDVLAANGGALATKGSPNDSCTIEITFQPNLSSSANSLIYAMLFEIQPNQWIQQNLSINFNAKDPALLTALEREKKPVFDENSNIMNSYALPFGNVHMNQYPYYPVAFDQTAGFFKRLEVKNNNPSTRGSLLREYQEYYQEYFNGGTFPGVLHMPDPGDYVLKNGLNVVTIARRDYDNGDPRIIVEATEGCLIGDDEPELGPEQKGFYIHTTAKCFLNFYLYLDINYSGKTIAGNDATSMDGNYIKLKYYNNDRASYTPEGIVFHFEGSVEPNRSNAYMTDGSYWMNVTSNDDKEIHFEWNLMDADETDLGPITGYRVFISDSPGGIIDVLTSASDYYDVTTPSFDLSVGLVNKKFYYFTVAAIRSHADYSADIYDGLSGAYLSKTAITALKVVVPPTGTFYDHDTGYIIERDASSLDTMTYNGAVSHCSGRSKLYMDDAGVFKPFGYVLMNEAVWDMIESDPANSTYPEKDIMPHWLKGPYTPVDTYYSGYSGFMAGQNSQLWDENGRTNFYLRSAADQFASLPQFVGGFGATNPGARGLLDPDVNIAIPRCYIEL
jgi:hypothetical protein